MDHTDENIWKLRSNSYEQYGMVHTNSILTITDPNLKYLHDSMAQILIFYHYSGEIVAAFSVHSIMTS